MTLTFDPDLGMADGEASCAMVQDVSTRGAEMLTNCSFAAGSNGSHVTRIIHRRRHSRNIFASPVVSLLNVAASDFVLIWFHPGRSSLVVARLPAAREGSTCYTSLTVNHILIECPQFNHLRQQYHFGSTLKNCSIIPVLTI